MKIFDGFTTTIVGNSAPLNHAVFEKRAADVLNMIDQTREQLGLAEALNVAFDRYVDGETHPELKRFAQVIALARRQAVIQDRLDEDREQLHHGHLDHDELVSKSHHYEMLRHEACSYNHLLRGLIESCGQYFSRDELMDWLVTTSQGRSHWAHSEITGAISEIALHAALQGIPELADLRYASLEEDLSGYDFVATWQGRLVTIDAKTGLYAPLSERKHGHRHLEISVPHEAVSDFRVTRRGLDLLRHEVRQALYRREGSEVHASHGYFRPQQA